MSESYYLEHVIDCRALAQNILARSQVALQNLPINASDLSVQVVLVGDDPRSLSFIQAKRRAFAQIGLPLLVHQLPASISEPDLRQTLQQLSSAASTASLILQLPLPDNLRSHTDEILSLITPQVDADVLNPLTAGIFPPTVAAIWEILQSVGAPKSTDNILILGRGRLVGQPLYHFLQARGFQVAAVDEFSGDWSAESFAADIIISAMGQPHRLTAELVQEGTIIIDAGTSEVSGQIQGDVNPLVSTKARWITSVPGGVGPVTVAKLVENTLELLTKRHVPTHA